VPHSYSPDGLVRFGDTIILKHLNSDRTFACDPYEDIFPNLQRFLVTASTDQRPTARNTFRITRPPPHLQGAEDDPDDEVLKYGEAFLLACNESLLVSGDGTSLAPSLYLSSAQKNERTSTKVTNKQSVYMNARVDSGAVWLVTKPSRGKIAAAERFVSLGQPVDLQEAFILSHRATNTFLTVSSTQTDLTEFGLDLEVYCTRENCRGKLAIVEAEFRGTALPNNLFKHDLDSNELAFVMATDPTAAVDNRALPNPPALDELLDDLVHTIKANGFTSLIELRKGFQEMDSSGGREGETSSRGGSRKHREKSASFASLEPSVLLSGRLALEDVKTVLSRCGVITQDGYYDPLFRSLDHLRDGVIDYRELMSLLRGTSPLDDSHSVPVAVLNRAAYLREFYRELASETNDPEFISLSDLMMRYHPSDYPLLQEKKMKESEWREKFFKEVIETSKKRVAGKVVTGVAREQFLNYFMDLSGLIKENRVFEDLMTSSFRLKE
jgi:hypothetical protein